MDSKNIETASLVTTLAPDKKNKRELLNVLRMYSPAVIALNDLFFGSGEKKEKTKRKAVPTNAIKKSV